MTSRTLVDLKYTNSRMYDRSRDAIPQKEMRCLLCGWRVCTSDGDRRHDDEGPFFCLRVTRCQVEHSEKHEGEDQRLHFLAYRLLSLGDISLKLRHIFSSGFVRIVLLPVRNVISLERSLWRLWRTRGCASYIANLFSILQRDEYSPPDY